MNKDIHDSFNKINALVECLVPYLQVIPKRELERIKEVMRPWANGTLGIVAVHKMSIEDLRKSEEVLTHAIKVIEAVIVLQTLLIREPANQSEDTKKEAQ